MKGNLGSLHTLLELLRACRNRCPIVLSSSVHAGLKGRFSGSVYGASKLEAEKLLLNYADETGAKVYIYRFPNIFGKWCKPNYNSVVATFCDAIANGLDYVVNDPLVELELVYIDDLVDEMLEVLRGNASIAREFSDVHVDGGRHKYYKVPLTYKIKLGHLVRILERFREMANTPDMPEIPDKSLEKKLFSTFVSYLGRDKLSYPIKMSIDNRGVFAELFKFRDMGQVSINIVRPGNTRGRHWHHSKWEIFIVVSGHGLIRERKIGMDSDGKPFEVHEYEVTGDNLQAVRMIPGYTHSITNLSDTENLVTVMWANEEFDRDYPDTFFEWI